MKYTGKFTRVSKTGKIRIPPKILKQIGIDENSTLEFSSNNKKELTIKKRIFTCIVTGETSDQVREILPGIYLSQKGMKQLLDLLKEYYD